MKEGSRQRNAAVSIPISDFPGNERLRLRLGAETPTVLTTLGNLDLMALPKTALFCSARCPGSVILAAYDLAARWRDAGRCIISGFHSPVEEECLRIMLRGSSPVIICLARSLPRRIPAEWKTPLAENRILVLSSFSANAKRVTRELAILRNVFVAALADEVCFIHSSAGSHSEHLIAKVTEWDVPYSRLDT
jgi:predicted Rossmann fold nucleotide-binding protein DprA/Smf involved in DNA uptake